MATVDQKALETAIEELSAVELDAAPKNAEKRYAHFDHAMRAWYCVTAGELELYTTDYLGSADESTRNDAYSLWCAATTAPQMPEGWTPPQD